LNTGYSKPSHALRACKNVRRRLFKCRPIIIILYYARRQHKNKKNTAVKMKNTHNYRRKIKRKTIKSKSEYTLAERAQTARLKSTLLICPGET